MGTGRDAVVKLVKSDSDQASIAVYIRSDSSTTVTGIPDGVYRVLYATGDGYNARHATFRPQPEGRRVRRARNLHDDEDYLQHMEHHALLGD